METTQKLVENLVGQLKEKGVSVQKIEKACGFSNGLLGKVLKGKSNLSEDKLNKLGKYCFDVTTAGQKIGYLKVLSDGTTEMGQIEDGLLIPIVDKEKEGLKKEIPATPKNLAELKAMCPHTDKDEMRVWVATERQKYGI